MREPSAGRPQRSVHWHVPWRHTGQRCASVRRAQPARCAIRLLFPHMLYGVRGLSAKRQRGCCGEECHVFSQTAMETDATTDLLSPPVPQQRCGILRLLSAAIPPTAQWALGTKKHPRPLTNNSILWAWRGVTFAFWTPFGLWNRMEALPYHLRWAMTAFDHFSLQTPQLLTRLGLPASMYFLAQTWWSAISVDAQGGMGTGTATVGPARRVTAGADKPAAQSSAALAVPRAGTSPALGCPRQSCCRLRPRSSDDQGAPALPTAGDGRWTVQLWAFYNHKAPGTRCQGKGWGEIKV